MDAIFGAIWHMAVKTGHDWEDPTALLAQSEELWAKHGYAAAEAAAVIAQRVFAAWQGDLDPNFLRTAQIPLPTGAPVDVLGGDGRELIREAIDFVSHFSEMGVDGGRSGDELVPRLKLLSASEQGRLVYALSWFAHEATRQVGHKYPDDWAYRLQDVEDTL